MTLELRFGNYTKWSSFFEAKCGKFGLMRHIDGTTPTTNLDAAWMQADCCVRSWIYGTISESVLDFAMALNQSACQLWVAIQQHFQTNQAPLTIYLSHDFHSMTQGDLSIEEYNQKMKQAVDRLHDVGQPISEPNLILNLLRRINPKFSTTADFIAATADMTFTKAVDHLSLKELRLANEDKVTSPLPSSPRLPPRAVALPAARRPPTQTLSWRSSSIVPSATMMVVVAVVAASSSNNTFPSLLSRSSMSRHGEYRELGRQEAGACLQESADGMGKVCWAMHPSRLT
ncbi:unnamed protein product [Urochloa humidicola]